MLTYDKDDVPRIVSGADDLKRPGYAKESEKVKFKLQPNSPHTEGVWDYLLKTEGRRRLLDVYPCIELEGDDLGDSDEY